MTDGEWLAGVRSRMETQRKLRPHRWSIWATDYERLVACAEAAEALLALYEGAGPKDFAVWCDAWEAAWEEMRQAVRDEAPA